MKKLSLTIALIFALSSLNFAEAATTKPSPKPSSTKMTEKKTEKNTTTLKKKKKKKPRPRISNTPSPSPTWPPAASSFAIEGEVYAKVQKAEIMASDLTDWRFEYLRPIVKECTTIACGHVYVASENGCTWWEAEASVYEYVSDTDQTLKKIGVARSVSRSTKPQQFTYIIFKTPLPLTNGHAVQWESVSCHHDKPTIKIPYWSYNPTN